MYKKCAIWPILAILLICMTSHSFGKMNKQKITTLAADIISSALSDSDPRIRANSAEVVADCRLNNLMPKVQTLLDDPFVPVRYSALLAIGDQRFMPARLKAKKSLKDPDENIKLAASYCLFALGEKKYINNIRKGLASKDPSARANAVVLLGKAGDKKSLKMLYKAANDTETKVSLQAAETIAKLGDEKIYPKLWTMLLSIYADVRVLGVESMGNLGTNKARNALLTMLDDNVLEVRLAAAGQLGKLGDKCGEDIIVQVFKKKKLTAFLDNNSRNRIYRLATIGISNIGDKKLAKYLPKLLTDKSKQIQLAAASSILRLQ